MNRLNCESAITRSNPGVLPGFSLDICSDIGKTSAKRGNGFEAMRHAFSQALRRVRTGQSSRDDGSVAPEYPDVPTYGLEPAPGVPTSYLEPANNYVRVQLPPPTHYAVDYVEQPRYEVDYLEAPPDDGSNYVRVQLPPNIGPDGQTNNGLGYIGPDGRWHAGNPCYGPPRIKCHWPVPGEGNDRCCAYYPFQCAPYNPCIDWSACRVWRGSSMSPLIGYVTG